MSYQPRPLTKAQSNELLERIRYAQRFCRTDAGRKLVADSLTMAAYYLPCFSVSLKTRNRQGGGGAHRRARNKNMRK